MTVVTGFIGNLAGERPVPVTFRAPVHRETSGGNGVVNTRVHTVVPVDGIVTSPDLEPGPAVVAFEGIEYEVTIPDQVTIGLFTLIAAAVAFPPGTSDEQVAAAIQAYFQSGSLVISDVAGLETALEDKSDAGHGHAIADVTGLQAALNSKASAASVADALDTKVDNTRTVNGHGLDEDVVLAPSDIGLGAVENTSDLDKPVSTAQQAALNLKADKHDAALTGTPTAPTATPGTATTQLANCAFVSAATSAAIAALVNSSPAALDTLNELAASLGNDPNFATTITSLIGTKQPIDPTLSALAALVGSANKFAYFNGGETMALADLTEFARSILDDADAPAALTTLGVSTFIKTLIAAADAAAARTTLGAASAADPLGLGIVWTIDPRTFNATRASFANGAVRYARVTSGASTISKIRLSVGTQSGNIAVGVYSSTGSGLSATPDVRLATSGVVACPPTGANNIALGSTVAVKVGDWLAIWTSDTTATFACSGSSAALPMCDGVDAYQTGQSDLPATATAVISPHAVSPIMIGVP